MALDRQSIEKKDFPIGRRGYEPESVDAHLRRLADEIDGLKRQARPRAESIAAAASEQVRAIVEAAETSAAEIQRQAEDEARQIREEASEAADRTRTEAAQQAREYVGNVSDATQTMMSRVDAMESELGALIESLRTGTNRLTADLALLRGNMDELSVVGSGGVTVDEGAAPAAAPEPVPAAAPEVEPEATRVSETPALTKDDGPPALEGGETAPEVADGGEAGGDDDAEGARLIALSMALNGTPREETDRFLVENFGELQDRDALLDEVYARVGG